MVAILRSHVLTVLKHIQGNIGNPGRGARAAKPVSDICKGKADGIQCRRIVDKFQYGFGNQFRRCLILNKLGDNFPFRDQVYQPDVVDLDQGFAQPVT